MTPESNAREPEIIVAERVRPRDMVLFAITLAALAVAPWAIASAGSEPVSYQNSSGSDSEAPAWLGVLVPLVPLAIWSGLKAYCLLRRPAAAIASPGGIRLYSEDVAGMYARHTEPDVDLPWEEVARIVVWRIRTKVLWLIPAWEARIGVEKTTDRYGVTQREATEEQLQSRESRPDGSPIRLGAMLNSRSVRLSPRGAVPIAAAAARFAPRVEVVDERCFGKPATIKSKPSRGNSLARRGRRYFAEIRSSRSRQTRTPSSDQTSPACPSVAAQVMNPEAGSSKRKPAATPRTSKGRLAIVRTAAESGPDRFRKHADPSSVAPM
jgi:hypothetical protein